MKEAVIDTLVKAGLITFFYLLIAVVETQLRG
jgi:hypothetical protein